jgi:hypothetical protein
VGCPAAGRPVAELVLGSGPCGPVVGMAEVPQRARLDGAARHQAGHRVALDVLTLLEPFRPVATQPVVSGIVAALLPRATCTLDLDTACLASANKDQLRAAA